MTDTVFNNRASQRFRTGPARRQPQRKHLASPHHAILVVVAATTGLISCATSPEAASNSHDSASVEESEARVLGESTFRDSCASGDIENAVAAALPDWSIIGSSDEAVESNQTLQCWVGARQPMNEHQDRDLTVGWGHRSTGRGPSANEIEDELASREAIQQRVTATQTGETQVEFYVLADRVTEVRHYISQPEASIWRSQFA